MMNIATRSLSPRLSLQWLAPVGAALLPIVLAILASSIVLLCFGKNPLAYYEAVLGRSVFSWQGLQEVLTRMAPLLLICAGLIFCFSSGVWNLGSDGQFLVAATIASAAAMPLASVMPQPLALAAICLVGFVVGGLWAMPSAILKVRFGMNEIVTSLMLSLLGARLSAYLVKVPFKDMGSTAPQTVTLPVDDRFPPLFGTGITSALVLGVLVVLASHVIIRHSAFGLRLRMVGANPRAAAHAGEPIGLLTLLAFGIGGGLAGMGGAVEVAAITGNLRADENPAYGLAMLPLVFLARFNGIGTIFLTLVYAILVVGAKSAARKTGVPQEFIYLLVGLVLLFMALMEWVRRCRLERQTARTA